MSAPKKETQEYITYVAQAQLAHGIEWGPWEDMEGCVDSLTLDAAIGKVELYHHFMLHGYYPEPYGNTPGAILAAPVLRKMRNAVIDARKLDGIKVRTRIVKRVVTVTLLDEEVDPPMMVKHGEKT